MKKILSTIFFSLCVVLLVDASHLVGGELTYECQGGNWFKFTLNVYRDCASSGPGGGGTTPFDNNARFTIFTGDGNYYNDFTSPAQQTQINIPVDLGNPCLIPPANVCVDRAWYTDSLQLPYNPLGYFITYQRCCRNNSISNIGNPGQTGATYTTFISAAGQLTCNSNPTFNNFPPVVICQNQPIDFDHSATDVDGDSLVYSFCSPSVGGGPGNAIPNPASAPPYAPVSFIFPYSASAPLASNVAINPSTGMITGSPTTLGQFVVGVCVDEYKNGNWVGSIKRDFQFNVTTCAVSVQAGLTSDSLSTGGTYFVKSCVDSTITFDNQSGQAQFITGYLWEFNVNGNTISSTAQNPTITFPGNGTYVGSMIVNPNSTGCSDTAYVAVEINRNPVAAYSYTFDSCVIGPINFQSSSFSLDGNIVNWDWDMGDDSTLLNLTTPSYLYQDAGTFDVRLLVTDDNGCVDSTTQILTWAPTPIIDIVPSTASGCIPLDVTFENNSYPVTGYSLFWTLGDGFTSTASDPVHTYQDTGYYTVTVYIESPLGCFATDTFTNIVNVRNAPTPNFYYLYDSCEYEPVSFFNTSQNGDGQIIQWNWSLENDSTITAQGDTAAYQYASNGTYDAILTVVDDNDCEVSITKEVDWTPAPVFPVELPDFSGCVPLTIAIEDDTYPLDGYFTLWDFGDGYFSDNYNQTHTYEDSGFYDMKLTVISRTACVEEFVFPSKVTVNDNPVADFAFTPDDDNRPSLFYPTVQFSDASEGTVAWNWTFGNEGTSVEENPIHVFQDTGQHIVTLVATHATGCQDTISQVVDVKPAFTYYLPNAFTPNDDGKNDGYRGTGELFGISNFNIQIWSRWGELMFESNDPLEAWNGRVLNTGQKADAGVYVVIATMTGPRGLKHEYKGFATIVN